MKRIQSVIVCLFSLWMVSCSVNADKPISADNLLVYSTLTASELPANDGSFNTVIDVTLIGDETFSEDLTNEVDFDVTDYPDGLDLTVDRVSDTEATITISGTASSHSFCSDTTATFFFKEPAFDLGILPIAFEIPITFSWITPVLTFSTDTLEEDDSNNGSITDDITVTASGGGTFLKNGAIPSGGDFLTEGVDFTWDLPDGMVGVVTADASDPTTVVNVSIIGTAETASPAGDTETELKFLPGTGVTSDFCTTAIKQKVDVKFQRTVIMYATTVDNGNLDGETSADAKCYVDRITLPEDYTGYKAFVGFDAANDPEDLDSAGVPDDLEIESENGTRIAVDWDALFDADTTPLINDLSTAEVTDDAYWTGSDVNGNADIALNCDGFTSSNSGDDGIVGDPTSTAGSWLNDGTPIACNTDDTALLCVAYTQ